MPDIGHERRLCMVYSKDINESCFLPEQSTIRKVKKMHLSIVSWCEERSGYQDVAYLIMTKKWQEQSKTNKVRQRICGMGKGPSLIY